MKTKDFYFAAVLMCKGAILEKIIRDDSKIVEFQFDIEEEEFDEIQLEWIQGSLMINAFRFKENIQKVKSLIYAKN